MCADYFMVHRLAGEDSPALSKNRDMLGELIVAANAIGTNVSTAFGKLRDATTPP